MKTLLPIVLFLFSSWVYAQNPTRFPLQENTKWKIQGYIEPVRIDSAVQADEDFYYHATGDTVIGSFKYFKVYKTGVLNAVDPPYHYDHEYRGALRDSGNKVYFIAKDKNTEVLLYDYNLELYDTIKAEIGKDWIVKDVDTLMDGRKVFSFGVYSWRCGFYIIEGVGSTAGLLESDRCNHVWYSGYFLTCFTINDEMLFAGDIVCHCDITGNTGMIFQPGLHSVWHVSGYSTVNNTVFRDDLFYFTEGDTVIQERNCIKLYKSGQRAKLNGSVVQYYRNRYTGAIRSDEKKIYYIESNSSHELLLYDFELNIGDTIKSYVGQGGLVYKIDTIANGRKRFYISREGFQDFRLFEGIGSSFGLVENNESSSLDCYSENNVPVYYIWNCMNCISDYTDNLYPSDSVYIFSDENRILKLAGNIHYSCMQSETCPEITDIRINQTEGVIAVDLFYTITNIDFTLCSKLDCPIQPVCFDALKKGWYELIFTVHLIDRYDTVFNYKKNKLDFYLSENSATYAEEGSAFWLVLFPNPSDEYIHIVIPDNKILVRKLEIISSRGEIVLVKHYPGNQRPCDEYISLHDLPAGIYFIRLTGDNYARTEKLIVRP